MQSFSRPAVMAGGVAAGIGQVAPHRKAKIPQRPLRDLRYHWGARRAVTIAEDNVQTLRSPIGVHRTADRRHRMAIDEQIAAEPLARTVKQFLHGRVVREVVSLDPSPNLL